MEHPCPRCGSECEPFIDCPGYGDPVKVCSNTYAAETETGKHVIAQGCGNAWLWVCQNLECDWEFREPNNWELKRFEGMERPKWMNDPWIDTLEDE